MAFYFFDFLNEKLFIFLSNGYNYGYMRNIFLIVSMLCIPFLGGNAYAQTKPQKTWEPREVQKKTVRPLNLKSILRGNSSSKSRASGPVTNNPVEALRSGAQLPVTQALMQDADYNPLRDAMRRYNSYDRKTDQEAANMLQQVKASAERNLAAQMKRRNEFYFRHGMTDEYTREYLRTEAGKLTKKEVRKELREERKEEREQEKLLAAKERERNKLPTVYAPFPSADDDKRTSSVVVPTSKPGRDGTVKPFFYR